MLLIEWQAKRNVWPDVTRDNEWVLLCKGNKARVADLTFFDSEFTQNWQEQGRLARTDSSNDCDLVALSKLERDIGEDRAFFIILMPRDFDIIKLKPVVNRLNCALKRNTLLIMPHNWLVNPRKEDTQRIESLDRIVGEQNAEVEDVAQQSKCTKYFAKGQQILVHQ